MNEFVATRAQFHVPAGLVYFGGNSPGALPKSAAGRAAS